MNSHREKRDEDALDKLIRQAFARQEDEAVPADLADVALSRRRQAPPVQQRSRARRARWVLATTFVGAGIAAALLFLGGRGDPVGKSHLASKRVSVPLDGRAVAVMEPGSALVKRQRDWRQSAGNVFYRVERGGVFVVSTTAGDVEVLGTCFRVEIEPMKVTAQTKIGFVAGATLAASVVVTVYEGRVRLANGGGRTELAAGEQATMGPGGILRRAGGETGVDQSPAGRSSALSAEDGRRAAKELLGLPKLNKVHEQPAAAPHDHLEPVRMDALPDAVTAAITRLAAGRSLKEGWAQRRIHDDQPYYRLKVDIAGIEHHVNVDEQGKLLRSDIQLGLGELPPAIIQHVNAALPGAVVLKAARIDAGDGSTLYYEVNVRADGKRRDVKVTEDGQIL